MKITYKTKNFKKQDKKYIYNLRSKKRKNNIYFLVRYCIFFDLFLFVLLCFIIISLKKYCVLLHNLVIPLNVKRSLIIFDDIYYL